MNIIKRIAVTLVFLCAATVANAQEAAPAAPAAELSSQAQAMEFLRQQNTWRYIKGNFANTNVFLNTAVRGFQSYFKKYNPIQVFRNDEILVMSANYGKHDLKCTFFKDAYSQYVVVIESDWQRDKVKWIENVVKHVEKAGKQ